MAQRFQLTPLARRILIGVAAVVGLALLIFGISALSSTKQPAETTATTTRLSDEARAELLANQALAAASKDETVTARSLADEALKLNATNQVAIGVIRRLDETAAQAAPKTPSTPATSTPTAGGVWANPSKTLTAFLPKTVPGWSPGDIVALGGDAQVTFKPDSGSTDQSKAIRATFFVHDRLTPAKASSFVATVDKRVYPGNSTALTIGTQKGYFGTDGARLAVAAFSRGRYAFEVVVYSQQGIKPATLAVLATKLAAALPAAK